MDKPGDYEISFSGRIIAKNTLYNLWGNIIPSIIALFIIPLLIKGMGEERFGILNIAWIIIGYFSFFDLGIGRALTKIIAEKIGSGSSKEIPHIFWTSFSMILFLSIVGSFLLIIFTPTIVYHLFNITGDLQYETKITFYVLAASIPIITTNAGLKGVLEAYQKFGIINIIKTILGIFTFVAPLLCLIFTDKLYWIVLLLTLIRIIIGLLYLDQCLKLNIGEIKQGKFEFSLIKPIFKLSGWMTVSNTAGPLIVYLDRFLIGALVSATAITFYATPFLVISRLLLIPEALASVLFPAFSANYLNNRFLTKKLLSNGVKYIFVILFPVVLLILSFAHEGMYIWLGKEFANKSFFIVRLFAIGILLNSIAQIPFAFLQGIGKPNIPAKAHLIELPVYVIIMWFAIKQYGINGAAIIWLLRIVIDTLILFLFTKKFISMAYKVTINQIFIASISIISVLPLFISNLQFKITLNVFILVIFFFITWKFFLMKDEKKFLFSYLKISKNNSL